MDWANEPYVKVYTRETDDDLLLSWEARALWDAMLKKFDRSGRLETRRGSRGLAALVRIPLEVVERALPELLEDGRVRATDSGYFAPNFLEAQEASKSDRLRQRESRERRAKQAQESSAANNDVTNRDRTSRDVTASHEVSQNVTLTSADPIPLQSEPLPNELSEPSRDTRDRGRLEAFEAKTDRLAPISNARNAHPRQSRGEVARAAWDLAAKTHSELRLAGVDRNAPVFPHMVGTENKGWKLLLARVDDVLSSSEADRAHEVFAHRIEYAKREAIQRRTLDYFVAPMLWNESSFEVATQRSLDRAGNASRPPEPPTLVCSHGDEEEAS